MYAPTAAVVRLLALALGAAGVAASMKAPPERVAGVSGVVEGMVRLDAPGDTDPPMRSPYARRRHRAPTPAPAAPASPVNVVVYLLDPVGAPRPVRDTSVAIAQRDRTIIPHVTAVQAGTRIEFPNQDEVFHNLFSLSDAHEFNLGRYPPGESRSEVFPRAGVVRMFCDIHSEMGGVILVLDSPWFARPDGSGHYRITGVPAGRHRVVAWHESAGADTVDVVVADDRPARADFRLPR